MSEILNIHKQVAKHAKDKTNHYRSLEKSYWNHRGDSNSHGDSDEVEHAHQEAVAAHRAASQHFKKHNMHDLAKKHADAAHALHNDAPFF